jgi:membrane associated rhomboid family serine protease
LDLLLRMQLLFHDLSKEQADTFGLVLLSSGMTHEIQPGRDGWELWVADDASAAAQRLLQTYQAENKPVKAPVDSPLQRYPKTWSGLWGAFVLLVWYVAVSMTQDVASFQRAYASSASHILQGEWYRCATALLLHADSVHLLGNLVGMTIFATAVCSITGWGMGWLLILGSGILGNLINAYVYASGHRAIGASTAVFGALGLLCAYQFIKKVRAPGSRFQIWLPLGAGLALLAFLGASTHTDILAHLFGLLSGIFLGFAYYRLVPHALSWRWQAGALAGVVFILATAWFRPIFFE